MSKKYGGVITNWQIHNLTIPQEMIDKKYPNELGLPMVFTGTILKDSPKFKSGFHMRSSLIVNIDREYGSIETMNTHYDVVNEGDDVLPDMGNAVLNIFY